MKRDFNATGSTDKTLSFALNDLYGSDIQYRKSDGYLEKGGEMIDVTFIEAVYYGRISWDEIGACLKIAKNPQNILYCVLFHDYSVHSQDEISDEGIVEHIFVPVARNKAYTLPYPVSDFFSDREELCSFLYSIFIKRCEDPYCDKNSSLLERCEMWSARIRKEYSKNEYQQSSKV